MAIEIVPFKAEHWLSIPIRPEICKEEHLFLRSSRPALVYEKFPSLTILDSNRIIACFGGIYLQPLVAESWLRTAPDIFRYKKVLIESCKNLENFCVNAWSLKRIQTTVQKDWKEAIRLVEKLGYVLEAELPFYVGDSTFLLYGKIINQRGLTPNQKEVQDGQEK